VPVICIKPFVALRKSVWVAASYWISTMLAQFALGEEHRFDVKPKKVVQYLILDA
jgi:hypothetical protein